MGHVSSIPATAAWRRWVVAIAVALSAPVAAHAEVARAGVTAAQASHASASVDRTIVASRSRAT